MTAEAAPEVIAITDRNGQRLILAGVTGRGLATCALCRTELQRTATGDLAAGVRSHYQFVHPEEGIS